MNRDIFFPSSTSNKQVSVYNNPRHAPSVTTTLLLQTQASLIQMISKLKTQKKGVTPVIQIPIRWGLLFGLLVVDGVAGILKLDQENMICCSHQQSKGNNTLAVNEKNNDSTPSRQKCRATHNDDKKKRGTQRSSTPSSSSSSSRSSSRSSSISNKHWPSVRRVTAQRDLTGTSSSSGPTHRLCRQVSATASEKSATRSSSSRH